MEAKKAISDITPLRFRLMARAVLSHYQQAGLELPQTTLIFVCGVK